MQSDINRVFVSGTVLGPPVVANGKLGTTVLLQLVGTERFMQDGKPVERKEVHNVVVFPPLAKQAALFNEGDRALVEGGIRYKDITKVHIIATRLDQLAKPE